MTNIDCEPEHSIGSYSASIPTLNCGQTKGCPARFAGYVGGELTWNFLGEDGVPDCPVGWVGPQIAP